MTQGAIAPHPAHNGMLRAFVAAGITAPALIALAVASENDARGVGFLLWFRHEGRGVATEGTLLLALFVAALALTVGAFAAGGHDRRFETVANVAVKAALLGAVAFMLAFPDLPQFENKSLTYRAIVYPTVAAIPALLYAGRGIRGPYPTMVDLCLTLALAVDIVGNDLHWYGNWRRWDDVVHFLNTLPIMFVLAPLILTLERQGLLRIGRWAAIVFAVTIYLTLHGLWEISEHLMDRYAGTELQPGGMQEATRNNLASVAGALLAAILLAWWTASGFLERSFVAPLDACITRLRA